MAALSILLAGWRELAFRRAMAHAIDRQELVDSLMAGLSTVAHTYLRPTEQNMMASRMLHVVGRNQGSTEAFDAHE